MKKQLLLTTTVILMAVISTTAQVTPTVYADGFSGLIGINFDNSGNLWATEQGTGNDDARITIIAPDGSKSVFMTGLPSTYIESAGETVGAHRTYQLPNNKVMIIVGEGVHDLSETILIVDKSNFTPGTPLTLADVETQIDHGDFIHSLGFVQSNPFNVTWDAENNLYITDSGANSIVKWESQTGTLSIVKTLPPFPNPLPFGPPMIDPVPTKALHKPDGTFFVSQLTGFPFIPGAAHVYNLTKEGDLSIHASGFSCLTDMAFDPNDGNLCVLQFAIFGEVDSTLNFILCSAAVIKLLPDGNLDTIAQGIGGLAPSFTFDAEGNLYVSDLVFGQILKYQLSTSVQENVIIQGGVKTFPNPFSDKITIQYELLQSANVVAEIIDLNGRSIASFNPGNLSAGTHQLEWAINNLNSSAFPAGNYIYRIIANKHIISGVISHIK